MTDYVRVQTFKEGLLSRMAHDLQLHVGRFEVTISEDQLDATFDPSSLRIDGVVKGGRVDPTVLSTGDRRKIQDNIEREVLHARRHGPIQLSARIEANGPSRWRARGELTLLGVTLPLTVIARAGDDGRVRSHVVLVPSRWGVRPYRALGGAIRIQDKVVVEIDLERAKYSLPE
jgi:polyisoprenoid-binding protein YceI